MCEGNYKINYSKHSKLTITLVSISVPFGRVACGGGEAGASNSATGVFVDSPVAGIKYQTDTFL
jgi:hypothetical protein